MAHFVEMTVGGRADCGEAKLNLAFGVGKVVFAGFLSGGNDVAAKLFSGGDGFLALKRVCAGGIDGVDGAEAFDVLRADGGRRVDDGGESSGFFGFLSFDRISLREDGVVVERELGEESLEAEEDVGELLVGGSSDTKAEVLGAGIGFGERQIERGLEHLEHGEGDGAWSWLNAKMTFGDAESVRGAGRGTGRDGGAH